jgi:hypothetical protein
MYLSTPSHSIPVKLSWSRSSTGSWDSGSSESITEQSGHSLSWWSGGELGEQGGRRSRPHGLIWGLGGYHEEQMAGERTDQIFWEDVTRNQAVLGDKVQWDKPDLLDRLIMEDEEERAKKFKYMAQQSYANLQLPSLKNLLQLLELQQMLSQTPPDGRPITGGQASPPTPTKYMNMMMNAQEAQLSHFAVPPIFPGKFPPINIKIPPPHHPPAVPARFHLPPTTTTLHPTRSPFPTPSTLYPPSLPTPGSATSIKLRVEEAKWQFQALEKERKKTEAALALQNPGKKISSSNSVQIPRLPLGPTKLDKLLVDCLREQARVVTLLERTEKFKGCSFGSELYNSLAMWRESIMVVMGIMRRERMGQGVREIGEEVDEALARMSGATRKAR